MIQAGDTIGPYSLLRTLGRGAFGEVWLAERVSTLLTTRIALKLSLDVAADLDAIRQESQIWLKASGHTNIVPVLDAEVYSGQVVIASEYMAGGSLENWLSRNGGKASSIPAAIDIMRGILAGLEHLHQNGLIHCDLKPGNVLLQGTTPRLTDFGLTRVLKSGTHGVGHTSNLAGTPGYMAPEVFKGQYSPASDVWAAGILLHELLVGSLPYPPGDFYTLLLAITRDEPVVLSEQVPDTLRSVLTRALAKPVSDRFASAPEMAGALAAAMASRSVSVPAVQLRQRHNLPVQTTSFIGREKEIEEIKSLLSKTRLLTLTGSGGCGKTRLSMQAAIEVLKDYPDGVRLTELAALADPALVAQVVAQAVGVKENPGESLLRTLTQALKSKKLLLVLDNCEHLLTACAQLVDSLLRTCPDLKVLASSREGLNIAGELIYGVPSLTIPDGGQAATIQSVRQYESVLLFIERAQFHQPSFTLSDSNAPSLARLCRRLDGIPLAIELAAARVRAMPVEQIASRMDDRFRLLTGGIRTALPRQQTLRALMDWSYDLLTDAEKQLLCRLSVFMGGWTIEATERVCAGEGVEACEVLDVLMALVDKSLVVYEEQRGEARYRLLETIRQYSRDRLQESREAAACRIRHRDYFLALTEVAAEQLKGPEQGLWLNRLETEHDNLRQALTFCLEEPKRCEEGLRFGAALLQFWQMRGHLSEGRERMAALLGRPEAQEHTMVRADTLRGTGALCWRQGDYASARTLHQESLVICRELGDRQGIATSLSNLGLVAKDQGEYASARVLFEESLAIFKVLGDRRGIAASFGNLGLAAYRQGDYALARALHQESLEARRELGDRQGIATTLTNLGNVSYRQSDFASARTLHEESLEMLRELNDRQGMAACLSNLGLVAKEQSDYASARARLAESLAIRRELGDKQGVAASLFNLGLVAHNEDDYASTRALYQESLVIRREIGDKSGVAESLESFASFAAQGEKWERAVRLWASAEALRENMGSPLSTNEETRAAREAVGEAVFTTDWEKGRSLTMEQAIEFALEPDH